MTGNFVSISGMIVTALVFAIAARLRLGKVWMALLAGAALWAVAIALKFAWGATTNLAIATYLVGNLGATGGYVFYLYVGLLTGIFECGLIWLAARYLPWLRTLDGDQALALGYGFGAFEAFLIGIGALVPTLMSIYAPESLPAEVAAYIKPTDWAIVPAATVERIAVIFVHAFTTYAIVYAIRFQRPLFFWMAFAFKSAIDAIAAWGQLGFKLDSPAHVWALEAVVAVFGAVSVWGILMMRKRWPAAPSWRVSRKSGNRFSGSET